MILIYVARYKVTHYNIIITCYKHYNNNYISKCIMLLSCYLMLSTFRFRMIRFWPWSRAQLTEVLVLNYLKGFDNTSDDIGGQ